MLYVIRQPLGDELKNSVGEDDNGDYRTRHDFFMRHALMKYEGLDELSFN
jgi:hypothetical protein